MLLYIKEKSKKRPTHEEVLKYINMHYHNEVCDFIEQIKFKVDSSNIDTLLAIYPENLLSEDRKKLIKLFLIEKVRLMAIIIHGKEV